MRFTSILLLMGVVSIQCAVAQERDRADTTVYKKEEITVTSVRGEEELREVPLAITVVTPVAPQQVRGAGLDELLNAVPGALVQSRSGSQDVRVQIRGFGARGAGERSNAATSRGVRFVTDGIPETEPDGRTSLDLVDLSHISRIEVIRSNASTLWGNASGGVVSMSTVPLATGSLIDVSTGFGSFGLMRQSVLAKADVGSGLIYGAFNNVGQDGWRTHSRSQLTQFTLGTVSHPTDATDLRVFATAARNYFQIPGALTVSQYEADPQQAQDDPAVYNPTYVDRDERRDNRLARVGTTVAHTFNEHHALSGMAFVQGKFLERSERNTFRDFTRVHAGGNAVYHANATIGGVRNKMLVGSDAQFQDGAILFYSLDSNGQRGEELRRDGREAALNVGVFAQDEIMLNDWSILVGARYDAITYSSAEHIAPSMAEERTYEQVTPKLGLNWRMTEETSLYANLGGGIEVPAGNETTPTSVGGEDTVHVINPLLEPIRSTTFEIGMKGALRSDGLVRSMSYDGAVYYIDIRNDLIPYRNGRYYFSAGKSMRMGGEVGVSVRTAWDLTLSGSFTYMRSEYVEYTVDSTYYGNPGASADLSGNAMAGIPDVFSTVSLRYDAPLPFPAWVLAEARSVGTYFADDRNTLEADAYTVLDAAIGVDHPLSTSLSIAIALRVNNLFDSKYMASVWINPDTTPGGTPYIEPGLPRNFSLSIGLRWNQ